jgi:hypothetical protein
MSEFGCLALGRGKEENIQPIKAARGRVHSNSSEKVGNSDINTKKGPPPAGESEARSQVVRKLRSNRGQVEGLPVSSISHLKDR